MFLTPAERGHVIHDTIAAYCQRVGGPPSIEPFGRDDVHNVTRCLINDDVRTDVV